MKAFLKGVSEYILGTAAGRVIAVAVVAATAATGTGVAVHAVQTQAQDKPKAAAMVMEVSSNIMSSSSDIASRVPSTPAPSASPSSAPTATVDPNSAVSAINKAAADGVSKVNDAASKAVIRVQAAASSSTVAKPVITVEQKTITWTTPIEGVSSQASINNDLNIYPFQTSIDTSKKQLSISYGGHFYGGNPTVTIEDASGKNVAASSSFCTLTVPYTNLSDISTLYFCAKDQKIKITVSE